MRVYVMHNLDGTNRAMAAAKTLKGAAELMGTSAYYMRQMGWQYADGEKAETALAHSGKVLYQPIDARDYVHYPWREKPYHRSRFGGWE